MKRSDFVVFLGYEIWGRNIRSESERETNALRDPSISSSEITISALAVSWGGEGILGIAEIGWSVFLEGSVGGVSL